MRRIVMFSIILLCIASPIVINSQADNTETNKLELTSDSDYVIHRGETIEATITVRNLGNSSTIITFSNSMPENISITNLPEQFTLTQNQIRQFRFFFSCDDEAPYEQQTAFVNITSELEPSVVYSSSYTLTIARNSSLSFGVVDDSEFIVDPGVRTNLAVNMTNNGQYEDDVTFSLSTNSGWQWGWNMDSVNDGKAIETFAPNELKFIRLWIDIPQVIDSSPLYLTGPRFSLTATSGLDGAASTWNFDLLMTDFSNVTLVGRGSDILVSPDSSNRLPITVRNSGNIENLMSIDLQIVDENNQPVSGIPVADRIEYNGWIVAIFGGFEDELLFPGDTRTFDVGFQSPNQNDGELNLRVKITPSGAASRAIYVDITSQIDWNRSYSVELNEYDCVLLPAETCNPEFRVFNEGNYQDIVKISVSDTPSFVTVQGTEVAREIPRNSYADINSFAISTKDGFNAYTNGIVTFEVMLEGKQESIMTIDVEVIIAPSINWSLQDLVAEEDALGRYNIAMTLKNDGNAADGIIVQLQCSHFTPMTLIPPTGSIIEDGVEFPRSFEINNIGYGSNFTVRAWAEIPTDQPSNGTMFLNITIRSSFAPDEPISFSSSVEFLGDQWQTGSVASNEDDFFAKIETSIAVILAWKWVILSLLISGLFLRRAYNDRILRKQDAELLAGLANSDATKQGDDWMRKFERKEVAAVTLDSPSISADEFTAGFKRKSAGIKTPTAPVNEQLRNAAELVLDNHDKTAVMNAADELLDSITVEGINSPRIENNTLQTKQFTPSMTTRNDPQNLLGEKNKQQDYTKTVPLPDEDDLDL